MKTLLRIFATILLLYSLSLTKEDTCGTGQISVSGLGKCKNITDLLGNNDLKLKTQNLLYLASNKEGKIEKDGYKLEIYKLDDPKLQSHNMRKSKLYISNSCFEKMKTKSDLLLDKSKGIVIIVYDSNNRNDNNCHIHPSPNLPRPQNQRPDRSDYRSLPCCNDDGEVEHY